MERLNIKKDKDNIIISIGVLNPAKVVISKEELKKFLDEDKTQEISMYYYLPTVKK
jgi:hypothetical protein